MTEFMRNLIEIMQILQFFLLGKKLQNEWWTGDTTLVSNPRSKFSVSTWGCALYTFGSESGGGGT